MKMYEFVTEIMLRGNFAEVTKDKPTSYKRFVSEDNRYVIKLKSSYERSGSPRRQIEIEDCFSTNGVVVYSISNEQYEQEQPYPKYYIGESIGEKRSGDPFYHVLCFSTENDEGLSLYWDKELTHNETFHKELTEEEMFQISLVTDFDSETYQKFLQMYKYMKQHQSTSIYNTSIYSGYIDVEIPNVPGIFGSYVI